MVIFHGELLNTQWYVGWLLLKPALEWKKHVAKSWSVNVNPIHFGWTPPPFDFSLFLKTKLLLVKSLIFLLTY